jgi:hypothetical protein
MLGGLRGASQSARALVSRADTLSLCSAAWQGSAGDRLPYADLLANSLNCRQEVGFRSQLRVAASPVRSRHAQGVGA